MLVGDARQALKESAPMDRLRTLTPELQQVYHALSTTRPTGDEAGSAARTPGATT